MYYTFDEIEKKNRLFNFIITPRSAGKTVAMKLRVVEKFLNEGKRFVYIRRNGVEIENKRLGTFFDKIQSLGYFKDKNLTYEKGLFLCDKQIMGYACALSTSINERSMDFVNVSDIYFEEFCMKPDAKHQYLNDEVMIFLDLYSTIAREEEIPVWFLGNKLQEFNPYYLYFDINPPSHQGVKVWKDFAIEIWQDSEFVEKKKNTRFGKIVAGTKYSEYAIENKGYTNNINFKRKLPKRSTQLVGILYHGKFYTLYYCLDGSVQMTTENPHNNVRRVCIDSTESSPDCIPLKLLKQSQCGSLIINSIKRNSFYYTNSKAEEVGNIFKKGVYFI